jgi:putative ABC transport system permease protein
MPKRSGTVFIWLKGLFSHRSGRLIAASLGAAVSVAMVFSIIVFITSSTAAMTRRATESLPIDWQVQLVPGTDPGSIVNAARQAAPLSVVETVGYADISGMTASTQETTQTTGAGKAVGLAPSYFTQFPTEFRTLLGVQSGVLIAQQTAANLHATVGDTVTIQRIGLPPVDVQVAGIIDLPYADTFFQAVGTPANVAPQAPPDNILILSIDQWHTLFDPQETIRPDTTHLQLHIRLQHNLPPDPNAAFIQAQRWTRNLEARIAGSGIVGDNLSARLDGVRTDALYAHILFLFLGLPGVLLAVILTFAISTSGKDHQRQDQALLRVRGATTGQIIILAVQEGMLIGFIGGMLGIALGWLIVHWITTIALIGWSAILIQSIISVVFGLLLSISAVVLPAWKLTHQTTITAARQAIGLYQQPLWQRLYLDILCLILAVIMFWHTAGIGYELVLAPEGVARVSVSSEAFIAPLFLWIGSALLVIRLGQLFLTRGRQPFIKLIYPIAGNLSGIAFSSMNRQRLRLAQGMALVALAMTFAVSTAIFNTTYDAQARVDAELTNGADVLVQGTTDSPAGNKLAEFKALPGVIDAEPMQHRFAYVGTDLQDIYGIDPTRIGQATHLANTYFASRNAQTTLADLVSHPDGVLVSEETKNDYQLVVGDRLNLRIQNAIDHQYHIVPFTFIGVVREFPTAPKDSFLVANAGYISQQTGSNAAESVLIKTNRLAKNVSQQIQKMTTYMPGVTVTDIGTVENVIGSSLTAISLHGLTTLELAFSVLLVASASGLILALGFEDRKRMFITLTVIGAKSKHLGVFVWSEGLTLLLAGLFTGALAGFGLAKLLVLMLTHVFDPPPDVMKVPWTYLALLVTAMIAATVAAILHALYRARRAGVDELRTLL